MLKQLMQLFKKKEISEIDKELKKYPKKDRERLRFLFNEYQQGRILKIENGKIFR